MHEQVAVYAIGTVVEAGITDRTRVDAANFTVGNPHMFSSTARDKKVGFKNARRLLCEIPDSITLGVNASVGT